MVNGCCYDIEHIELPWQHQFPILQTGWLVYSGSMHFNDFNYCHFKYMYCFQCSNLLAGHRLHWAHQLSEAIGQPNNTKTLYPCHTHSSIFQTLMWVTSPEYGGGVGVGLPGVGVWLPLIQSNWLLIDMPTWYTSDCGKKGKSGEEGRAQIRGGECEIVLSRCACRYTS